MNVLGTGLYNMEALDDALSVREVELSTMQRVGAPEEHMLAVHGNLASAYRILGRFEQALQMQRYVYSRSLALYGEEHRDTLVPANSVSNLLVDMRRYEEAKSLLRRTMPVARRIIGENDETTIRLTWQYGQILHRNDATQQTTLDEIRASVAMLGKLARTARRVLGGAHPVVAGIEESLGQSRAALAFNIE